MVSTSLGRGFSILAVVAVLLAALAPAASATSVLLYDDTFGATQAWGTALNQLSASLSLSTTVATSNDNFRTLLTSGGPWDLVILQLNNTAGHDDLGDALTSYLATSGRIIFSFNNTLYDDLFQLTPKSEFGPNDTSSLTFLSTLFTNGLTFDMFGGVPVECPTGGTCFDPSARSFMNSVGTVAALLNDGDGILVNGDTIVNPFVSGYLGANEVQLYKNEIGYLVAVPEPATGALLGLGLIVTAALGRRRRK